MYIWLSNLLTKKNIFIKSTQVKPDVFILFFVAIILINACDKTNETNDQNEILSQQIEGKWIFKGFYYIQNQSEKFVPDKIKEMNLKLMGNHSFSASSSCNGLGGYIMLQHLIPSHLIRLTLL